MKDKKIGKLQVQQVDPSNFHVFNSVRKLVGIPAKTWLQFEKDGWTSWLIQSSGQAIGVINVVPMNDNEREIGFTLVPDERRKGILSATLGPFVAALKEPLYSETAEGNIAAKRVLEKAGFRRCEAIHKTHVCSKGIEVTTLAYRFLKVDRKQRQI